MPDCKCKALRLSPVKTCSPGQQRILGKSGAASIFVHGRSTGETICYPCGPLNNPLSVSNRVHSLGFGALTLRAPTGMLGQPISGQLRP